jgi:predicted RecB family nuclease
MTAMISIKGGTLTAHFAHRDPLETCLAYRVQQGIETDLQLSVDLSHRLASTIGIEHEAEVVGTHKKSKAGITIIGRQDNDPDKAIQIAKTVEAMRRGDSLISSGFLLMGKRITGLAVTIQQQWGLHSRPMFWGEPDLLRRVDDKNRPSAFGSWHYEVADIKSARHSKLPARLQVAFYSWLLEEVQGVLPEAGHVVTRPLTSGPPPWEPFPIAEALPIAELFVREEYWSIVTVEPETLISTSGYGTPLAEVWAKREGLLVDDLTACDHAALPGMRLPARRGLYRQQIRTVTHLALATSAALDGAAGPGATRVGLEKQQIQAQVCVAGRPRWRDAAATDLNAIAKNLTDETDSGLPPVELSDHKAVIIHFDMESDPFAGIEYLFGYRVHLPNQSAGETQFIWAPTADAAGEQAAFESFLTAMEQLITKHKRVVIVHYSHYEPTHLGQLAEKYPGNPKRPNRERVIAVCGRMLDTYRLITASLWLPFSSYSIKQVAPGLADLPAPGGSGTGHSWLIINSIAECAELLTAAGADSKTVTAAVAELKKAKAELELDDEADLLSASAAMSIVWHDRWRRTGAPIWRQLIEWYNADDLRASDAVHRWLTAIARGATASIDPAGVMKPAATRTRTKRSEPE